LGEALSGRDIAFEKSKTYEETKTAKEKEGLMPCFFFAFFVFRGLIQSEEIAPWRDEVNLLPQYNVDAPNDHYPYQAGMARHQPEFIGV
jgi:hypothetical protein